MTNSDVPANHSALAAPYILNCWYVAAWASELAPSRHMKRVLLDRPVLLLRDAAGHAGAIGNICPHRFASLNQGRFEGGIVECPYHGLRFDMAGRCVHNPHGTGTIPARAKVPSYPLVERHGALWIWPGNADLANPSLIPDLSFLNTARPEERASGYLHTNAHYQLLCDNIMDLSHADFIHSTTLGTGGELARSRVKARSLGDIVTAEWSFPGKGMVIQREARGGADVMTRFEVTWHAAGVMILRTEVGPIGNESSKTRKAGVHIMTPETRKSTHYFFENGEAQRKQMLQLALRVFETEDGVMLEEVQRNMGDADLQQLDPVFLANDNGAALARRVTQRLIKAESHHTDSEQAGREPQDVAQGA